MKEDLVYVPGIQHCPKCSFTRTNKGISPSGDMGYMPFVQEDCPNRCGPLEQMTWKKYGLDAQETAERFFNEVQDLKALVIPLAAEADKWDDPPGVHTMDNVELWQNPNRRPTLTVGLLRRARELLKRI